MKIPEIESLITREMEIIAPLKAKCNENNDAAFLSVLSIEERKLALYRLIKKDLLDAKTSQKRKSTEDLSEDEIKAVWQSEIKKRKKALEEYSKYEKSEKIEREIKEIAEEILWIDANMPEDWREVDEATVRAYAEEVVKDFVKTNMTITMKNMGYIMGEVKKKYPTANGKVVSDVVKAHIGKP